MTGAVLAVDAELTSEALNTLFHASWPGHRDTDFDAVFARRLLHVTARRDGRLVGYVNVVGDGGAHAFLLDTTVHPDERRQGLGPVRRIMAGSATPGTAPGFVAETPR